MTMLYLLRHGRIDWPEADCFIGQTDASLNLEGRRQAGAWRSEIGQVKFSAVWSSDLRRTAETAAIIFSGRKVNVRNCRDLREIQLGRWEGMPRIRVREELPDLWAARGMDLADFKPPGGESFRELQHRVVRRVKQIAAETAGAVCIVTHAGVIRVLICHLLEMPLTNLFRIRLDYGSLSIVSCQPEHVEVCTLNLRPSDSNCLAGEEIGRLA